MPASPIRANLASTGGQIVADAADMASNRVHGWTNGRRHDK